MEMIVTVQPQHTDDQSKRNISQITGYLASLTNISKGRADSDKQDPLRTKQHNDCDSPSQESNNRSTHGNGSAPQNVDSEAVSSNKHPTNNIQPKDAILPVDHKETENIAHILQVIGDSLDASVTDCLSEEIVEALRSIGDSIDAKIGPHSQNFMKIALGLSRINVGTVLFQVLRPSNFVGSLLCTSLQLLLHYNSV